MYKKFLLKCSTMNHYIERWEDREYYFDTVDEMKDFIKKGTKYTKPEDIKVGAAFELNKIDLNLN